jgi:hypothetical protein
MPDAIEFADPWPAPDPLWADPPWLLSGTCVTAWFESDAQAANDLMSPSFEVLMGSVGVPTRFRFYDIEFQPRDGSDEYRTRMSGRFREAVIAFKGSIAGHTGEYSAYMWSDDEVYTAWGREVFGWPLVRGRIDLDGPVWRGQEGGTSVSTLHGPSFAFSVTVAEGTGEETSIGPGADWLTPRRVIFPDGSDERRDLNIVRPTVVAAGTLQRRGGSVEVDCPADSWLDGLRPLGDVVEVQTLEGFCLCVGDNVDTITLASS